MNPAELRTFRHDVANALNQILGYSELVCDSLEDYLDHGQSSGTLRTVARGLIDHTQVFLGALVESLDAHLRAMRNELSKTTRELWSLGDPIYYPDFCEKDLHRLRAATERLESLLSRLD
jgi:hypothetical protein